MRRRWAIMITLVSVVAIVTALTLVQPRKYEAQARILARGSDRGAGADLISSTIPALGAFADQRNVQTQVEIVRSWPILAEAARRSGIALNDPRSAPVRVEGGKDDNIIAITARSTDPQEAADLANNVSAVFIERNLNMNRGSARAGRMFLEKQQVKLKNDLDAASRELRDYRLRHKTVGMEAQTDSLIRTLAELKSSRNTAASDGAAASARVRQLRAELDQTSETVVSSESIARNPRIESLQDRIAELQVERAGLLKDFASTSRRVQALDDQIAVARDQQTRLVGEIMSTRQVSLNPVRQGFYKDLVAAEGEALAANARLRGLNQAIAARESELSQMPEQQFRLAELQLAVQVAEKTYLAVQDRYQQLRIAEESTLANAEVMEPALLPTVPVSPKVKLNLVLGVLVGLMLGVGLAALLEALDVSISSADDLEKALGLPLLGTVGRIADANDRSLVRAGGLSEVAEAFRLIRSNIAFLAVDRKLGALTVTSTSKGEGKTTTAVNLAVTLAQVGRRVLLMDCDLRRPNVHHQFGLSNSMGLTNAIAGGAPVLDLIQKVEIPNLHVITSGPIPPNPAELLDSERFNSIREMLKAEYDLVICDVTPILGVADALVLAGKTDGVVFVVGAGEVDRGAVGRALQSIQQAHGHVLGAVLNKANRSPSYYEYYYRYTTDEEPSGNGGKGSHSGRASTRQPSGRH